MDEWRLVLARLRRRQLFVPVGLHVPVSIRVPGVVLLGASNFDLPETPLRQVDVTSSQIAAKRFMSQSERGGQGSDPAAVPGCNVSHNLYLPVVFVVAYRQVAVTGYLLVSLGNRRRNVVGMQVAAGLSMNQTDDLAVSNEARLLILVVIVVAAVRVEEPVVVGILVVVAGNLLLARAVRIRLYVGVQESSTITHVLDRSSRTIRHLERAVLANLGTAQVGLEEGTHLGVTWSAVGEDGKVNGEAEHVDQEWEDDQANDSRGKVGSELREGHPNVAELVPKVLSCVQAYQRGDEEPDQFDTSNTADADTRHEKPEEPLRFKALVLQPVEFRPAQGRGDRTAEEHGIEEDKSADGGVGIFAKNHERNQPDCWSPEVELSGSPVGHGNADGTEEGIELAHEGVVDIRWVCLPRLELEGAVVPSKVS